MNVPEEPYGRALREAVADPVDCRFALDRQLQNLVEQRGAVLLTASARHGSATRTRCWRSENRVRGGMEGDGRDRRRRHPALVDQLDGLAASVATWAAIGGRSGDLRIPVLDQAPFKRLDSKDLCAPLRPDLVGAIETLKRHARRADRPLVKVAAEPFDTFLEHGDKGLQLSEPLQVLKTDLDELKAKDFWVAIPVSSEGGLPQRATWRAETIDQTALLFDAYDRYRSGAFPGFESAFRRPLVTALTAEVARGLATRLSFDATEGAPLPTILGGAAGGSVAPRRRADEDEPSGTALREQLRSLCARAGHEPRRPGGRSTAPARDATRSIVIPTSSIGRATSVFNSWAEIRGEAAAPADALKQWAGFVDDAAEQRSPLRRAGRAARALPHRDACGLAAARGAGSAIVDDVARNFDQNLAGNGFGTFDSLRARRHPGHRARAGLRRRRRSGPAGRNAGGFFLTRPQRSRSSDAVRHCRELATIERADALRDDRVGRSTGCSPEDSRSAARRQTRARRCRPT